MGQEGVEELDGFEGVGVVWDSEGGEDLGVGSEERGEEGRERIELGRQSDEGEERDGVVGDWLRRRNGLRAGGEVREEGWVGRCGEKVGGD